MIREYFRKVRQRFGCQSASRARMADSERKCKIVRMVLNGSGIFFMWIVCPIRRDVGFGCTASLGEGSREKFRPLVYERCKTFKIFQKICQLMSRKKGTAIKSTKQINFEFFELTAPLISRGGSHFSSMFLINHIIMCVTLCKLLRSYVAT